MLRSSLEDELIEMHVELEAKALFKSRNLSEYWSNINTANKYPKLRTAAGPFSLAFPSSYMVEAGLSHVNTTLTRQRNGSNLQNRGDLQLKLTNVQPNINNNLAAAHQAHPSHYCQLFYYKGMLTLLSCYLFLVNYFSRKVCYVFSLNSM